MENEHTCTPFKVKKVLPNRSRFESSQRRLISHFLIKIVAPQLTLKKSNKVSTVTVEILLAIGLSNLRKDLISSAVSLLDAFEAVPQAQIQPALVRRRRRLAHPRAVRHTGEGGTTPMTPSRRDAEMTRLSEIKESFYSGDLPQV